MQKNQRTGVSRRAFLKGVAVGGASLLLPGTVRAAQKGEALATLHDLSKCIGCGECVSACTEQNGSKYPEPEKPFPKMYPGRVKVADWSDRQDVEDRLTPYNWLTIQTAEVEWRGQSHEINIPRRCMHCQNPPCANLCPWGACAREYNGVVRINTDICLGGSKCKSVCPWSIPQRQTGVGLYLQLMPAFAGNGVMFKCDRCFDLLAEGGVPACISQCPEDVQSIGPRQEILAKAHALAKTFADGADANDFIYGEFENGGTNTIYVSPVPMTLLARAIETGPGNPHMNPVEDMMARDEILGMAALAAPVAGVAAGVLTAGAKFLNSEKSGPKAKEGTHE